MDSQKEIRAWREVQKKGKFQDAFRGIYVLFKTTKNIYIQTFIAMIVILLGFFLNVSSIEWVMLVLCIGFVLTSEAFNTAIEIDIDLTSPEYHPFARDTKDVAAAAVLMSAVVSVVVGSIIFLPKILYLCI